MNQLHKKTNPLILGTWNFSSGYYSPISKKERQQILRTAISSSLFHFDSAYSYGNGKSEQALSSGIKQLIKENFLTQSDLKKFQISSKSLLKENFSVLDDIKKSLFRLDSDSLYAFFAHWPKPNKKYENNFSQLRQAKEKGMIKKIGVSNFSLEDLIALESICKIDVIQIGLNLLWLQPLDDIIPYCKKNSIAIEIYAPLAQGLLSSNLTDKQETSNFPIFFDGRKKYLVFLQEQLFSQLMHILIQMEEVAKPFKLQEAALLWLHQLIPDAYIVVGVSSANQLTQHLNLFSNKTDNKKMLSDSQFNELFSLSQKAYNIVLSYFPNATNIFNHHI